MAGYRGPAKRRGNIMRGWALRRVTARHGCAKPTEGGVEIVRDLRVAMQPCDHEFDACAREDGCAGQALQEHKTKGVEADAGPEGLVRGGRAALRVVA